MIILVTIVALMLFFFEDMIRLTKLLTLIAIEVTRFLIVYGTLPAMFYLAVKMKG
jgi:hypothetical protein